MRRVRILRLIARMNVGGPALQVSGLIRGLDPERYESRLLTGYTEAGEADFLELRSSGLPVRRIKQLGRSVNPWDDLQALRAVLDEVRSFQPDIVHTHTAKAGVLGRIAAGVARVPASVHTFHGHLLHGYFSRPATLAVRTTERALASRTDRLLAVGEQVRDELLEAGIGRPDQYIVMPPGIPPPQEYDRGATRREFGFEEHELVVAFVARLTNVKRPDRFIEVAESLARSHPNVRFLVAGEGPLFDDMKQRAAHLGRAIDFLGWVGEVGRIYSAADLVLLTSDNEGMPVSLIEAAMSGVPAVSTDVGSVREVVKHGETGMVTGLGARELAAACAELLYDDEVRRQYGQAARKYARERFSVDRLVSDTQKVYEELDL